MGLRQPLTVPSRPVHAGLMRCGTPDGKVKGGGTRFFSSTIMRRINFAAIALGALAAPLFIVLSAKADLAQLNDGGPVTVIKSTGGKITIHSGEPDGLVRVPGNTPGVQMNRFNVNPQTMGTFCVPRPQAFNPRHGSRTFEQQSGGCTPRALPLREGPHGVSITNPGSDLEVGVPNRMELMYVQAGASPVLMERTRGPYIIIGENDVTLRSVAGMGWVQTQGNVEVRNPQGNIGVVTGAGRIAIWSGPQLERAQFFSQSGDIEWTVSGVSTGPYRVNLGSGSARIHVCGGFGASIVATSLGGTVVNMLDPSVANVSFSGPHGLSETVGGGGAQVIVNSREGNITIAPCP